MLNDNITGSYLLPASINTLSMISRDKDILGGVPVFVGTRVPVKTLMDYLQKGHPLDDFLDDFPTVTRQQAQDLLSRLAESLTTVS